MSSKTNIQNEIERLERRNARFERLVAHFEATGQARKTKRLKRLHSQNKDDISDLRFMLSRGDRHA